MIRVSMWLTVDNLVTVTPDAIQRIPHCHMPTGDKRVTENVIFPNFNLFIFLRVILISQSEIANMNSANRIQNSIQKFSIQCDLYLKMQCSPSLLSNLIIWLLFQPKCWHPMQSQEINYSKMVHSRKILFAESSGTAVWFQLFIFTQWRDWLI